MSPGQKVLVYFGVAKPPAGATATERTPRKLLPTLLSLVVSGIVFGLLTWLLSDGNPVVSGVLFAVLSGIVTAAMEVWRRRTATLGGPGA